MSTISTHLRNFKEPTRDQLTQLFFALPSSVNGASSASGSALGAESAQPQREKAGAGEKSVGAAETELEKMEINAVLSLGVQGEEDSYVSALLRALGLRWCTRCLTRWDVLQ